MSEDVRTDELSGARVVVAGSRQHRPNRPGAGACPFCVGGTEAPEPYDVLAFPNRWPAFPDGRCEVVLYTPDHDLTFGTLGHDAARRVVDLWAERTAVLGGRPDIAYVLPFENRGAEVGATIDHPHGQIYAFDEIPAVPLTELRRADAGSCTLCAPVDDALLVSDALDWRAWVPHASVYPYALVLAPHVHRPDIPSLDGINSFRGSSNSSSSVCEGSRGSSILDLISISVAAITRKSAATAMSRLFISRMYLRYSSVIFAIGMSKIFACS
jgi:UDPglucose--hexose-1-phosphate uridylyltransferase